MRWLSPLWVSTRTTFQQTRTHRTSSIHCPSGGTMNIDTDVAVIGAGLAGLTAARELRRAGVDV
ncbi:FAD-dependent monooxygenase, partial [Mycolicibacterium pulveris]